MSAYFQVCWTCVIFPLARVGFKSSTVQTEDSKAEAARAKAAASKQRMLNIAKARIRSGAVRRYGD